MERPRPVPCKFCSRQIVLLPCPSGAVFPFQIESFPAEQVAERDQFAIAVRAGRIWAVPLDGAPAPKGRVQMRHYCSEYSEQRLMANVQTVEKAMVESDLFSGVA
jgi:hypothetical protein